MILDRAPETVKIFRTNWVNDGYGGGQSPVPGNVIRTVKAFVIPTGYAGAGWAANMRFASQGFADTARVTIIIKWLPQLAAELDQWTEVEAQGQIWTVAQAPRRWLTRRVSYVTVLCELKGDV
ncbi:hypothetical protein [Acrocarpospora sp. B8E8]|uniref:hypothetical protein n=1 Tax=Acrocarpospora sp. B8E8 TaxID=3153572 RepID=UPI00325E8A0E